MLDARNLLCCTTKLDSDNLTETLLEIDEVLTSNGVSKSDTTMYLSFSGDEAPIIHMYLALKKKVKTIKDPFWLKERLFLVQAVKGRHEGELDSLKESFSKIMQYLNAHQLSPITPFCCKVLAGLEDPTNTKDMIADIYIGVNGNIL